MSAFDNLDALVGEASFCFGYLQAAREYAAVGIKVPSAEKQLEVIFEHLKIGMAPMLGESELGEGINATLEAFWADR